MSPSIPLSAVFTLECSCWPSTSQTIVVVKSLLRPCLLKSIAHTHGPQPSLCIPLIPQPPTIPSHPMQQRRSPTDLCLIGFFRSNHLAVSLVFGLCVFGITHGRIPHPEECPSMPQVLLYGHVVDEFGHVELRRF